MNLNMFEIGTTLGINIKSKELAHLEELGK